MLHEPLPWRTTWLLILKLMFFQGELQVISTVRVQNKVFLCSIFSSLFHLLLFSKLSLILCLLSFSPSLSSLCSYFFLSIFLCNSLSLVFSFSVFLFLSLPTSVCIMFYSYSISLSALLFSISVSLFLSCSSILYISLSLSLLCTYSLYICNVPISLFFSLDIFSLSLSLSLDNYH